ncbi:hypothetical protein MMC28_007095 [Mycoblastus sanguinarius]|nr:hypothetical protein [Mycoblastus sanguinarius]
MTPFLWAAHYGRPDTVSFLLREGASINDTDPSGRTALHIAVSLNNYGVLRLLLNEESPPVLSRGHNGRNLIHFAACLGDVCTLNILQAASLQGLHVGSMDHTGVTGYEYALWRLIRNEDWSDSVVEPCDPDPKEWYIAFRALMDSIKDGASDVQERSFEHDCGSWEALNMQLADLNSCEDESDEEEDGQEIWADLPELPSERLSTSSETLANENRVYPKSSGDLHNSPRLKFTQPRTSM